MGEISIPIKGGTIPLKFLNMDQLTTQRIKWLAVPINIREPS